MIPRSVRVLAPAKVNLFLAVGDVLPDGYHQLESVFHALELHDDLTLGLSDSLSVSCSPTLGIPAEQNLVHRAAVAMGRAFGREPLVRIELAKRIPHGAGLGGGSSDAAATLLGLARLWGVDPRDERCAEVASTLGADVPFFLHDGPVLMEGRGDVAVRALSASSAHVVVVKPPAPVATADAYREHDRAPVRSSEAAPVIAALDAHDAAALGRALANDFEPVAARLVPDVARALDLLRSSAGVLGATVAGSGSAVFGLVQSEQIAHHIAEKAERLGWWAEATRLRARGAEVINEEGAA